MTTILCFAAACVAAFIGVLIGTWGEAADSKDANVLQARINKLKRKLAVYEASLRAIQGVDVERNHP